MGNGVKTTSKSRVVAIVVTYEPELEALRRLVNILLPQVESIVIVDNGCSVEHAIFGKQPNNGCSEVLCLGVNCGIATAQNIGIRWARSKGADYVLLMDQDSEPASDMVIQLLAAISSLNSAGHVVACVGPRYVDSRQKNPPPFIRTEGLRLHRCECDVEEAIFPVDYLVSSGCLIPMHVVDAIGGPNDKLFIDYVDIEWGMRARHHGFQSFGVCSARMQHSLGEEPIRFFGKRIPLHTPLRHYYHFRNAVLLSKEPWVPLNWKLVDGWRLCRKYIFYSLFTKARVTHWRMMTLGVWHGLLGRTGKFGGSVP